MTHVLIIAGADSSGGAGIARDIETVAALGLRTCVAVTAVTVQTHEEAGAILPVPAALVADQMRAAFDANDIRAIKIGMLATCETARAIASVLAGHHGIPAVLDPVLASSSGKQFLATDAIAAMKSDLMPRCAVITPNLDELSVLSGHAAGIRIQARALLETGCPAVLAKGGHAGGKEAVDMLFRRDRRAIHFFAPRHPGTLRGTGCILSSAIAACLAKGCDLDEAVANAKSHTGKLIAAG